MSEIETTEQIWETINKCINKIVNCEVFGFELTACYALVTSSIAKLQRKNPEYDQKHMEWKQQRATRISHVIREKMEELKV